MSKDVKDNVAIDFIMINHSFDNLTDGDWGDGVGKGWLELWRGGISVCWLICSCLITFGGWLGLCWGSNTDPHTAIKLSSNKTLAWDHITTDKAVNAGDGKGS